MALALLPKATKTEDDYEIDDAHPSSSFMTREQGVANSRRNGGFMRLPAGEIIRKIDGTRRRTTSPDECPASGLFDHVFCGVGRIGVYIECNSGKGEDRSRQAKNTNNVQDEVEMERESRWLKHLGGIFG